MNIDIKKIENIKDELADLKENQVLFIEDNGEVRYAVMPIESYDKVEGILEMKEALKFNAPEIKVIGNNDGEITFEEYEIIKSAINEAIDRTFKPKAEKLN